MGLVVLDSKLQQEHRLTKRVVATKLLEWHVMHGWAPQRSGHFGTARTCEGGQWTVDRQYTAAVVRLRTAALAPRQRVRVGVRTSVFLDTDRPRQPDLVEQTRRDNS